ncbi:MAG: hypothetical protein RLZZ124_1561, partial [Cyanobacteriota bacterium]
MPLQANQLSTILVPFLFKLAGAIALWIVGTWLIKALLRVLRRTFAKGQLDPTLIGFLVNVLGALLRQGPAAYRVLILERELPDWTAPANAADLRVFALS